MGKELSRLTLIDLIRLNTIGLTVPIYVWILIQGQLSAHEFPRCYFSDDRVY